MHDPLTRHPIAAAVCALTILLTTASHPALAQSPVFRLDDSGQWIETEAPEPGSDEALIAEARRHLAEDRPREARALLNPWIKDHERRGHELLPQAYLLRADAIAATGNEYRALYDYERVIRLFPASPEYVTAVERELAIGIRYVHGYRRKFLGIRWMDATSVGEELLIRVQERLPGSRLAERAGIELADYYYRIRDMRGAAEAYDIFLLNYPDSEHRIRAMQRRVYASIARFKGPRYNGAPLLDAKVLIQRFSTMYPAEAEQAGLDETLLTRLDESAGAEMLETARWYLRRGDAVSARYTMQRLVREHPRTAAANAAVRIMTDRGWLPEAREPVAPREEPTDPATNARDDQQERTDE